MKNRESRRIGYLIGSISVAANLVLFGLKYWAGSRSDSVAMVADAWHTLSDSFTSLVVIAGFWLAGVPGDREHPFGHGRAESIGAIIIGTLLAVVGVGFIRESIHQLSTGAVMLFDPLATGVFAASVVLKEAMAAVSIRVGRRMNSRSLIADGWHHRSDAVASALVLVGIFLGRRIRWIDGALGIIVSLLILYAAWEIVKGAADSLLGEKPPEDLVRHVDGYAREKLPAVSDIHRIAFHSYGDHKEMTCHVVMPADLSLTAAHELASDLEKEILERFDVVATVHAEPE